MNPRIAINVVLALALAGAGVYVLSRDAFFLAGRWHPERGMLFTGWALYSLAGALFGLAGFAGAVARAWWRGEIELPAPGTVRPHPAYKGRLIARFWYWLAFALAALVLGFALARPMPNPALQPPPASAHAPGA